jgi:hypothetical protein
VNRVLSIILLIATLTVALVISGCIGGIGGSDNARPTSASTAPGGATSTAQATVPAGGNEPLTLPDLYDFSKFTYLDTKLSMGGPTQDVRTEFSDADFNGVPAYRFKMTATINGLETVEDTYYDHAGKFLGGLLNDEELSASEYAEYYKDHGWVKCGTNFKLAKTGTDTVTVNGATYQCTVYTVNRNGVPFTFWWSPDAPAPVKVTSQSGSKAMTETLAGWG